MTTGLMFNKPLTAEQRIEKALVAIMAHPRYVALAGVLMVGKRKVVDLPITACTNGKDEAYGRGVIDLLDDAEVRYMVLHETYHKLYRHLTTWYELYKIDPAVANQACDHVINLKLNEENSEDNFACMPVVTRELIDYFRSCGRAMVDDVEKHIGKPFGLADKRFTAMHSGQVFDIIYKEQPPQGNGGGGGGSGSLLDEHDWDSAQEMTEQEQHELAREIDSAIRQGSILAGKVKGSRERSFEDLLQPKVDWRRALREFLKETCVGHDYSTWRKPNRRYVANGIYMPSGVTEKVGELVFAIDTSGSISDELRRFMTEVVSVLDMVKPAKVRLLYWDSHVAGDEEYLPEQYPSLVNATQPKGGGGTSPSCVGHYMRKNNIKPQAVVCFTDGYVGGDWGTWDCPVLWCIVGDTSATPSVGRIVHVE